MALLVFRNIFGLRTLSLLRLLFLIGITYLFSTPALAQTTTPSEYQVKAVFLYKFCLYVEWPPKTFVERHSPLTIGVADADQIASELEALSNSRTIAGRPLAVRRLDDKSNLDNLQMLFIARTQQNKLAHWINRAQGRGLLVVTEIPDGLDAGSSINFALQENRVRFDIDLATAQRQELKLSAQLLQVARTVRRGDSP